MTDSNFVNNNSVKNPCESNNACNFDDPSKIFYSIIDNYNRMKNYQHSQMFLSAFP